MNIAIIDLGSNTFHILIAKKARFSPSGFEILYKRRFFTGLSEKGVSFISYEALQRGLDAIRQCKKILSDFKVDTVKIVGTAILRTAENRQDFIIPAQIILQQPIHVISGQEEAKLIAKGIQLLPQIRIGLHLIMDIGGGSTEFILLKDNEIAWKGSYPLGVGLLYNKLNLSDPIEKGELEQLEYYILSQLDELLEAIDDKKILSLIGASGSFEVLEQLLGISPSNFENLSQISIHEFMEIFQVITKSSLEERLQMPRLPNERAKLSVVGFLLMHKVIERIMPQCILVSPFAMKEGILKELLEEK